MTVKELSQLYYLRREIKDDERKLILLKDQTLSLGSPNFSGMPVGGSGGSSIERNYDKVSELENIIKEKHNRCIEEQIKLETYISTIPDSYIRQIFTHRFVDGFSWLKVGHKMNSTADCVKKVCYRYLNKKT